MADRISAVQQIMWWWRYLENEDMHQSCVRLVLFTPVFYDVKQLKRAGTLRDVPKDGCEGDS